MSKVVIVLSFFCVLGFIQFFDQASAVCCFPYNMNHYVDPVTGDLVINGELQNDSYRREPFGNTEYRFAFLDKDNNKILERNIQITDVLNVDGGAVIPFIATFPFQIVLDDVDESITQRISSFQMDGTETLDYFSWKPADLVVSSNEPVSVDTVYGKNGDVFNKWEIRGNITNTYSQKTQNVYVVASLRNENNIIGVAGYSADSVQPVTLDGLETKSFVISALVPASEMPSSVVVYAESDESSMVYPYYRPVIMRDATDHEDRMLTDPKKPIHISANITNISRNDLDFEWIIQIKKSPKSVSESDITEYPESKVVFIDEVSSHIDGQKSTTIEYEWFPQSNGIYFYEMYVWEDTSARTLSFPFKSSFLNDNWMVVESNINSVTNQVKSGIPLDEIQCQEGLELAHKASNGNLVCIRPETKQKLIERGWAKSTPIEENPSNMSDENIFLPDENGKIDLSKVNLPPNGHGRVDYEKIGYMMSESQFKKILKEKNVEYNQDNFSLIQGMMLPMGIPAIEYCGYVISNNDGMYWFTSDYYYDTLKDYEIYDDNPSPCTAHKDISCGCELQTNLAEKNLKELSYLDESQELYIGQAFQRFLNQGNQVVNVPKAFVVGKYNLEVSPDIASFCGQFKGKGNEWYFKGHINGSKIVSWNLDLEKKSSLCAINDNAKVFNFE